MSQAAATSDSNFPQPPPADAGKLISAEQYLELALEEPTELVKGRIETMNQSGMRHGTVCVNAALIIAGFVKKHRLGHVTSNDSGIITARDPDTVRGADVAFYSFQKVPEGTPPEGYPSAAPDLVAEVLSPTDRWPRILTKTGEYLAAGAKTVLVLDPAAGQAHVYVEQPPARILSADDELTLPDVLPGFSTPVKAFFE